MGETNTIRGVWLGGLAIVWSYPLATLVPSAVLGAIGEVPSYLIDDQRVMDLVVSLLTAYLAITSTLRMPKASSGRSGGESSDAAWGASSTI